MVADTLTGEVLSRSRPKAHWIDLNGHMNVAWYLHVFDAGVDTLWQMLGIDDDYRATSGGTTFAAESHMRNIAEIREDDEMILTTQLIAVDSKRVHQFQRLYTAPSRIAATCEWMNLHVDRVSRKVSAWQEPVYTNLMARCEAHQSWPVPDGLGAAISMRGRGT